MMTPAPNSSSALNSLRDIEGVYGSFVLDASGALIARDLPPVFDDSTLIGTGARILRLWDVVSEDSPSEYAMVEFAEYSMFIRRAGAGCLCVIMPGQVNVLALRVASQWVARTFEVAAAPGRGRGTT